MRGLDPKCQLVGMKREAEKLARIARTLEVDDVLRSRGLLCAHYIDKLIEELEEMRELLPNWRELRGHNGVLS